MVNNTRVIVCAAIMYKNGKILVGPRHNDRLMSQQFKNFKLIEDDGIGKEGFLDQMGVFYDREQAYEIALKNNQIKHSYEAAHVLEGHLYTEHLY